MSNIESHKKIHKGYWIPIELNRFGLSKCEQLLLSIIDSLDDPETHCFASNAYLAKEMEMSESRVSFYLTKFKKLGLIEQVSFSGRIRVLRTCKEKWYAKETSNSKKESCVKSRSQTTRSHAISIRESTQHITKGNNKVEKDVDVPQAESIDKSPKLIIFRHATRNVITRDESNVIAYLSEKGFTDVEIQTALANAKEADPILRADTANVIERYLAGAIEKNRIKQIKEKKNNEYKRREERPRNREQDLIQRSREDFRQQAANDRSDSQCPGIWGLNG